VPDTDRASRLLRSHLAGKHGDWPASQQLRGALPTAAPCAHVQGFVPIRQAPSMFLCSSFSIAAGGSLGPEAPLLGGQLLHIVDLLQHHTRVPDLR
jgi:hypothetical protein